MSAARNRRRLLDRETIAAISSVCSSRSSTCATTTSAGSSARPPRTTPPPSPAVSRELALLPPTRAPNSRSLASVLRSALQAAVVMEGPCPYSHRGTRFLLGSAVSSACWRRSARTPARRTRRRISWAGPRGSAAAFHRDPRRDAHARAPGPAPPLRAQQHERAADLSHRRRQQSQSEALGRRGDEEGQRRGARRQVRLHRAVVLRAGRRSRVHDLPRAADPFHPDAETGADALSGQRRSAPHLSQRAAHDEPEAVLLRRIRSAATKATRSSSTRSASTTRPFSMPTARRTRTSSTSPSAGGWSTTARRSKCRSGSRIPKPSTSPSGLQTVTGA